MKIEEIEAIVLDTETTGLRKPQVVEVAFLSLKPITSYKELELVTSPHSKHWSRHNTTCPIESGAQRVHGIKKSDLLGKPLFSFPDLPIPTTCQYIIGHNIQYDWRAMGKPESSLKKICTLKLAKAIWKDLPSYKLVGLMQDFFPTQYETIVADAHGAEVDCRLCLTLITKAVLEFEFDSWESIYEIAGVK